MMGFRTSFECPWCNPDDFTVDPYFSSVEELAQHRDIEHPGKPIFICSACDVTFDDWQEACEHVLQKHDVFCDECQKEYIYEAISLTPEAKERIREIHDEIQKLRDEIKTLTALKIVIPNTPQQTLSVYEDKTK